MWSFVITSFVLGEAAFAAPYSEYILAPSSRTVFPTSVYQINGTVNNAEGLTNGVNGTATCFGSSSVTLDFGKNIAGVVSITAGASTSPDAAIWLTYTESSTWISGFGSDTTGVVGLDEPLGLYVGQGPGTYTVDRDHERGAFKYLSIINNGTADIELTGVSVYFTAAPTQDLQAYTGYFHSNDELLNRIWYAGAYTNQLCSIDPVHGNALVHIDGINLSIIAYPDDETVVKRQIADLPTETWFNNYTITDGSTCITDGAKRDRVVWPGDLAIAIPSIIYSTYDLDSVRNSLESLYRIQQTNGRLPYAGVPFSQLNDTSFTYHLHSLTGTYQYYYYSGDQAWLVTYWDQFKLSLDWSMSHIDDSGLMNVTSGSDWARNNVRGHNIEANAILYYVLNLGIYLAGVVGDTSVVVTYETKAAILKTAVNNLLWNEAAGLYQDNEISTLTPQDGNSWAVISNLTSSEERKVVIASSLQARWGPFGAPAPEVLSVPQTVSPFIGGFELEAHCLVGDAQAALDLMRLQWGFMLDDPRMTNSSFIEGYAADGVLLHYVYPLDQRVSHAHGWSSGPTSILSRYIAGIELTEAAGKTWKIQPMLGGLTSVDAGMSTSLGLFSITVEGSSDGAVSTFRFETPSGTAGDVVLPSGTVGSLTSEAGETVALVGGAALGVSGGKWSLTSST